MGAPEDWGEAAVVVLAVGAVVIGGTVGLGIAVGMGSNAFAQRAATGKMDMDDVAIAGVAGMIGAGVGFRVGRIVARPATVTLADGGRSVAQALTHYGSTGAGAA